MTEKRSAHPDLPDDVEAYNRFVTSVQPVGVRLISVRFTADLFPGGSADAKVEENPARWQATETGFTAIQPLTVTGSSPDTSGTPAKLVLELELEIEYQSREPMTDTLFETFGRLNLPVNARPFLREAVVNFVMRSGWPPLVLPAFLRPSRGAPPELTAAHARSRPASRKRREKHHPPRSS